MQTKIVKENGVNHLAVDGKILDTVAFKSFRPTPNNVGDFYTAGVRIFHLYCSGLPSGLKMPYSLYGETWFGDGDYRFEGLDRQMEMFLSAAPDAKFFINLHVDVRPWWLEQNPGNANSFTHLSQIAGNEKWRQDTADYIQAFIRYAESKYDDKILGYWILGGYTTEWFSGKDKEASHPVKLEAYRKYTGDPDILIPDQEALAKPKEQIFLDPAEDAEVIRYRKFHASLIADLVIGFCKAAKEALDYRKVVGLFFGYIMELSGGYIWNSGHLELDKVNECPYVDLIATPSSYQFRLYDDGTAYMILTDTLDLHSKAYFSSFDNLTFLTPTALQNPRRLCDDPMTTTAMESLVKDFGRKDLLNTREKTIHCMRREMMGRLAKRCGTWWFDMLEGWYYDDGLMQEVSELARRSESLLHKPRHSASEICVFVGTQSMYFVNKFSNLNTEVLTAQRGDLSRIGAPYDLFSMSDLFRVDISQYKLVIFLNAYSLRQDERDYINSTVKADGRSILFVGPADYINFDGKSRERMSALAEMDIDLLEKDEATVRAFNVNYGYAEAKNPTPYVREEGVQVLGRFSDSRRCALALREREDYKVFFSALGHISHVVFRQIAKMSGVHIYAEDGVFTYVNDALVGVYNTGAEETVVTLREDGVYTELFSGKTYQTRNKQVTLPTGTSPAQMLIIKP